MGLRPWGRRIRTLEPKIGGESGLTAPSGGRTRQPAWQERDDTGWLSHHSRPGKRNVMEDPFHKRPILSLQRPTTVIVKSAECQDRTRKQQVGGSPGGTLGEQRHGYAVALSKRGKKGSIVTEPITILRRRQLLGRGFQKIMFIATLMLS
jgi:hypothetical protein